MFSFSANYETTTPNSGETRIQHTPYTCVQRTVTFSSAYVHYAQRTKHITHPPGAT